LLEKPSPPSSENIEFISTLLSFKIAKDIPVMIDNGLLKIPAPANIKEKSKAIVSKYTMNYSQSKQAQSQAQIKGGTKGSLKAGAKTLGKSGQSKPSGGGGMNALSKSLSGIIKAQKRTQWAMQSKKRKGANVSPENCDDEMITEESHSDLPYGPNSSNRIEIAKSNKLEQARSGRNLKKWGSHPSNKGIEKPKEQPPSKDSLFKDTKTFGGDHEEK
jgi:hypothetical protein